MTTESKRRAFIRPATLRDAEEIARLAGQLGYAAEADEIRGRLDLLLGRPTRFIAVAAQETDRHLRGWIAAEERDVLIAARQVEITGLVVDDTGRGEGVGRLLVSAVERWAKSRQLGRVVVRSNIVRPESHPFYERLGYSRYKSQHVYQKAVSS